MLLVVRRVRWQINGKARNINSLVRGKEFTLGPSINDRVYFVYARVYSRVSGAKSLKAVHVSYHINKRSTLVVLVCVLVGIDRQFLLNNNIVYGFYVNAGAI